MERREERLSRRLIEARKDVLVKAASLEEKQWLEDVKKAESMDELLELLTDHMKDAREFVTKEWLERWFTEDERIDAGVFTRGRFTAVYRAWAFGDADVTATGCAMVWAYDDSRVMAAERSFVYAMDESEVKAYGMSTVRSSGNAKVTASISSHVFAGGSSMIMAYGGAVVHVMEPTVSVLKIEDRAVVIDIQHREIYVKAGKWDVSEV